VPAAAGLSMHTECSEAWSQKEESFGAKRCTHSPARIASWFGVPRTVRKLRGEEAALSFLLTCLWVAE
jgi:hypothetical protein